MKTVSYTSVMLCDFPEENVQKTINERYEGEVSLRLEDDKLPIFPLLESPYKHPKGHKMKGEKKASHVLADFI